MFQRHTSQKFGCGRRGQNLEVAWKLPMPFPEHRRKRVGIKYYELMCGWSELPPVCGMKVTFHSVRRKEPGKLKQSLFLPSLFFQPSRPRSFAFLESHQFLWDFEESHCFHFRKIVYTPQWKTVHRLYRVAKPEVHLCSGLECTPSGSLAALQTCPVWVYVPFLWIRQFDNYKSLPILEILMTYGQMLMFIMLIEGL